MTHGTPPSGQPDEIDRVFAAYFQHQMPKPWPTFQPTLSAGVARTTVEAGRSRATLAVSVAALLGLGLVLSSGSLPLPVGSELQPGGPGLLPGATAKGPDLPKPIIEGHEADKGIHSP